MKLSAIIIAQNEEKRIKDCLKTLTWADEVVVVDSGSTDKTAEVAQRNQARIVENKKGGFSRSRNLGAEKAKGDWIFYIDADERMTPALEKEILETIKDISLNAYAMPRKNIIFGKEFKHTGQWPDYVKRLFRKSGFLGWQGELHEEPKFVGELGHLKNPLIHLKHNDLAEMVEKTNKWSEIEARLMYEAGHPKMNIPRFLSAMFREFWLRMIRQMAFLDGPKGIIYALYQVFSRFVSYAKLWEMQNARRNL